MIKARLVSCVLLGLASGLYACCDNLQGKGYSNFHISNPSKNLVLALVIDKMKKKVGIAKGYKNQQTCSALFL